MFEGAEWITASKHQQAWGWGFPVFLGTFTPSTAQEVLFNFCVRVCSSACLER